MWSQSTSTSDASAWRKPLDRIVAFDLGDMTLGRALDRLTSQTGIHFSYSPDLVPVQRAVCLSVGEKPLGGVLVALLAGTSVSPVVVGADQVVLAPNRTAAGADAVPAAARTTRVLDRVVVTGTATGAPERTSPFSISRIDRANLQTTASTSLSAIMDGAVPGMWMWAQSPVNALARYGSIRGASSFGVSTPKIYIDGIEVANPLLLTSLDPAQIEYLEVIRGPQGAALYGADAISGVVNIQMRHDGTDDGSSATDARASAGNSESSYANGGVLAQEYGASVRTGSPARAASTSLSISRIGAFTPGASATQALASVGTRYVGSRVIVTGTGRLDATNAQTPIRPILRPYLTSPKARADSTCQRVRQYTLGGTATMQQNDVWTHAATLGLDGYRLSGIAGDPTPLLSVSDSALRAARGGADRLTLRLSSTRRLGDDHHDLGSLGFGLEHSSAREESRGLGRDLAPRPNGQGDSATAVVARGGVQGSFTDAVTRSWWSNTGLYSQARVTFNTNFSLTGGARLEHLSGPSESGRFALLPMLGTAWVGESGPIALKARAAYGRGIRPARTLARGASFTGGHGDATLTSLAPEEQSGVEAGADVLWGSRLGLHVTRFDQRASGLVQPVAILGVTTNRNRPGAPESAHVLYQLQNVGAIDNSGWELQGTSTVGALGITASLSLVDSRVAKLASGYLGDLHQGDRLLEVPNRTASLQARWTRAQWSFHASLARASEWINYDQIALAQTIATDATGRLVPVGEALRAYWRTYDGATRVGASSMLYITQRTSVSVTGVNLLNRQLGEPDNITVVPGRSILLGLQTTF